MTAEGAWDTLEEQMEEKDPIKESEDEQPEKGVEGGHTFEFSWVAPGL